MYFLGSRNTRQPPEGHRHTHKPEQQLGRNMTSIVTRRRGAGFRIGSPSVIIVSTAQCQAPDLLLTSPFQVVEKPQMLLKDGLCSSQQPRGYRGSKVLISTAADVVSAAAK